MKNRSYFFKKFFVLFPGLLMVMPVSSQTANLQNNTAGPQYTELKYSISFADQSQMAYDGMKLKQYINESFMETGDLAYYNGKYFNAAARYLYAANSFPQTTNSGYGLYKILAGGADPSKMDDKMKKLYTSAASTVGMMYQTRGKYVAAETLLRLAMDIREKTFGKTSREYINSLHNMAVLKKDLGQYDEAERMFNYLVPTFKKLFTVNSLQYVIVVNNRAMLLAELGRTKEAIALLDEALKLGEAVLSANYIDYERILTNRALLEQESGNLDKAEAYYQQALTGMEKKEMEDHPDYNNVLVYYGSLKMQKKDAGVIKFLDEVADKVKRRYGEDHPTYAKALENFGDYYLSEREYENARSVFEKISAIREKTLGDKHKDYLGSLMKLAACEQSLSDDNNAAKHFQKAISGYLFLVNSFFQTMSEPEKANFWRSLKPNVDAYLSFVMEAGQANSFLLKDAYDLWIKTKGIVINSTRLTRDIILNGNDTATRRLFNQWLDLKNTIGNYYSSPLEDLKEDNIDLGDLEKRANAMEKELSGRSARFAKEYAQPEVHFDNVRAALKDGEAAVEIMKVAHYYGDKKGEAEYAALIVKKGNATPQLLRIGNGADLEKYCSVYKRSIRAKVADTKAYGNYWQPVATALGDIKTVYISVDGVYNSINLNTLQQADGKYILDAYNLVLLSNTKYVATATSVLRTGVNEESALLVGSPEFGNDILLPPLPGSKNEVMRIGSLLSGKQIAFRVFTDQAASEENIKSAVRPALMHVATHGFFNANVDMGKDMSMGVQVSRARDNPLLRSGLLFNGAAAVYNEEPALTGSNNGVLYAYEAMNLDLQGTQLVVMSACETGTGEIVNGEGVYGLSRAFQVAGVSKIIMSLWKVDDQATLQLMTAFYENWMETKNSQEAFLYAQKILKETMPQPYYWGAFVLVN
ncbi:MAG: CHAT domain-containing tetratricopeptide repeat protein [Chitinophagaceae bacterium]